MEKSLEEGRAGAKLFGRRSMKSFLRTNIFKTPTTSKLLTSHHKATFLTNWPIKMASDQGYALLCLENPLLGTSHLPIPQCPSC
jgi:hypothetical protein